MQCNRREFFLAGLASRLVAQQRAATLLDRGFATVNELAPGIYATIADSAKGPQCVSNGGVIAGRDAVLIVEGHMQPEGAALEIEAARMVSKAPIRGAVDTHFHFDHSFGNLAYAVQRIPILAHEKVASLMKEHYAAWQGVSYAPRLAPLEKRIAEAVDAADRKRKEADLEAYKSMFERIASAALAYPTEALAPAKLPLRIDLGGVVAVIEFHAGHTVTDLIVRVPEHDLVYAGDLVFNRGFPVCLDADMLAWRKALDYLAGLPQRTRFIPGHRAICGVDAVREQAALFDDLHAHAEKMVRAGAGEEEASQRYVVPAWFSDYGIRSWDFTVGAAMRSYYKSSGKRH